MRKLGALCDVTEKIFAAIRDFLHKDGSGCSVAFDAERIVTCLSQSNKETAAY